MHCQMYFWGYVLICFSEQRKSKRAREQERKNGKKKRTNKRRNAREKDEYIDGWMNSRDAVILESWVDTDLFM